MTTQLRHGILAACGGAKRRDTNLLGLRNQYFNDPEGFFDLIHQRALEIVDIIGSCRVVIHMPAGWSSSQGMGFSCQSLQAIPTPQHSAVLRFLENCKLTPIDVSLYLCSRVSKAGVTNSNLLEDLGEMVGFDFNSPKLFDTYVNHTILPWKGHDISEFMFDGSSHHDGRLHSFIRLARYLRSNDSGITSRIEGIPAIEDDSGIADGGGSDIGEIKSSNPMAGSPDLSAIHAVGGAMAWDRFFHFKEKKRFWDVDDLVNAVADELICVISGHQTFDDAVPEDQDEKDVYLAERMRVRLADDLTVFNSVGRSHDDFLDALRDDVAARARAGWREPLGKIDVLTVGLASQAADLRRVLENG